MNDLNASIDEAFKIRQNNKKQFVSIADHIRHVISPTNSYPGILGQLQINTIDQIIDILSYFRSLILDNIKIFSKEHITRVIEAMRSIALAYAVRFKSTNDKMDLDNCLNELKNAIDTIEQLNFQREYQLSASAIYNIASFLMKLKVYNYSLKLFEIVANISDKEEIISKSNKMICMCLIALNKVYDSNFLNTLYNSCDQMSILSKLIIVNPPSNPDTITKVLSQLFKSSKSNNNANEIKKILPFYALHGDLQKLEKYKEYENFFPNLKLPDICYFNQPEIDRYFKNCSKLFENSDFYMCVTQSMKLLKQLPSSLDNLNLMLALFFLHYWIAFSYDAVGRPDAGLFYAKKIRKLFPKYPFTVGFSVFLELKCKIHSSHFERINEIPKIEFSSIYNWESVAYFHRAMVKCFEFDPSCIDDFDLVFQSNNIIVQQEAFSYFINTLREFQCDIVLDEFANVCSTSKETKALFLYHKVIENSKELDFKEIWNYSSKKNVDFNKINMNIAMLKEALKYANGFVSITRRIKQLMALLIGTVDMEKTAILISSSLSLQLDKLLHNCPDQWQLKFPILAIAYISLHFIEPCLLFAYFCPRSKPFVVRIETGDKVDDFLEKIEEIMQQSLDISTDLCPKEWWTRKLHLDKQLGLLIKDFETNVLGFWKCLLYPISPVNTQSPMTSVLSVYLQSIPQKTVSQVKNEIEKAIKFTFPSKVYYQNSQERSTLQILVGKFIHQIPWESIPFVIKNGISITRIPSMKAVAIQSQKQTPVSVNPHSAFYILNPNGDLDSTEQQLRPLFHKFPWKGFIKNKPDKEEMTQRLQNSDLYVYCGHGSGKEFFDYDSLINEQKNCKSTMFLMGCCSGKLHDEGEIDPTGVPYTCVAAGSGAVIANLYNVTDGEINRFLSSLLQKMQNDGKSNSFNLESAVLECKNACKLRFLTGTAPVVYGFPTIIQELI